MIRVKVRIRSPLNRRKSRSCQISRLPWWSNIATLCNTITSRPRKNCKFTTNPTRSCATWPTGKSRLKQNSLMMMRMTRMTWDRRASLPSATKCSSCLRKPIRECSWTGLSLFVKRCRSLWSTQRRWHPRTSTMRCARNSSLTATLKKSKRNSVTSRKELGTVASSYQGSIRRSIKREHPNCSR